MALKGTFYFTGGCFISNKANNTTGTVGHKILISTLKRESKNSACEWSQSGLCADAFDRLVSLLWISMSVMS